MFNFKSLPELLNHFQDEQVCWDYLEETKWHCKPVFPHCGSPKVYRLMNGRQFKCGNKKRCDCKFTIKVGTIFENSKIPLKLWYGALYLCTSHKKDVSSCQLARDLGCTQKTARFMLHRITRKMKEPERIH